MHFKNMVLDDNKCYQHGPAQDGTYDLILQYVSNIIHLS